MNTYEKRHIINMTDWRNEVGRNGRDLDTQFSWRKMQTYGENADYDIACDECDYFLICFPEWEEEFAKTEERYFGMSETMRQEPIFPLKKNFQKRVDFT